MNRHIIVAMGLAAAFALSACNKQEEATPVETAPVETINPMSEPSPAVVEQQADESAAAQACTQDCGDGVVATIQCAAGETAVCDCAAEPKAKCEPAAVEPMGDEAPMTEETTAETAEPVAQ